MPTVRSREEWQQLLAEHAASQQTIHAFCHDKGIGLSTFSAWKRRLRGTPPVVKPRAFVPVTVTQRSDVTVAVGPATLTLSSSVAPQWLAAFVKALQA